MGSTSKYIRPLLSAAFTTLFICTGYLVLRPRPAMTDLSFILDWLSAWADRNWDLRTAASLFSILLVYYIVRYGERLPPLKG